VINIRQECHPRHNILIIDVAETMHWIIMDIDCPTLFLTFVLVYHLHFKVLLLSIRY